MSRSRKKVSTFNYGSEKRDKRINNRKLRRANKVRLQKGRELLNMRDISDEWAMKKDGMNHILIDKDSSYYDKGFRK